MVALGSAAPAVIVSFTIFGSTVPLLDIENSPFQLRIGSDIPALPVLGCFLPPNWKSKLGSFILAISQFRKPKLLVRAASSKIYKSHKKEYADTIGTVYFPIDILGIERAIH
jgi:hypothetical protein